MFQEYNQIVPPALGENGITCAEFDANEELLWTGSTNVRQLVLVLVVVSLGPTL